MFRGKRQTYLGGEGGLFSSSTTLGVAPMAAITPVIAGALKKIHISKNMFSLQDRWMDDLQFYILFNSITAISGQWADDNERLCAIEPHMVEKILPQAELKPGTARSVGQLLTH